MGNVASHATGNQADGARVGVVGYKGIESGGYDVGVGSAYDAYFHVMIVF